MPQASVLSGTYFLIRPTALSLKDSELCRNRNRNYENLPWGPIIPGILSQVPRILFLGPSE